MPLASVATEPPNAVTARYGGAGPTISALSAPRIQAGKVNGSECTFSKPAAFSLASAHATARLCASVPARRCPISVVSDSTKSKAAGSLSALCPSVDAVTTNDSEGSVSVALIVAPALAARATATTRMRKILSIQIAPSPIHYRLNRSVSSSTAVGRRPGWRREAGEARRTVQSRYTERRGLLRGSQGFGCRDGGGAP